jgi:hypothetical protein
MTPLWFWEVGTQDMQARLLRRRWVLQKWVRRARGSEIVNALMYPTEAAMRKLLLGEGCSLLVTLERK